MFTHVGKQVLEVWQWRAGWWLSPIHKRWLWPDSRSCGRSVCPSCPQPPWKREGLFFQRYNQTLWFAYISSCSCSTEHQWLIIPSFLQVTSIMCMSFCTSRLMRSASKCLRALRPLPSGATLMCTTTTMSVSSASSSLTVSCAVIDLFVQTGVTRVCGLTYF